MVVGLFGWSLCCNDHSSIIADAEPLTPIQKQQAAAGQQNVVEASEGDAHEKHLEELSKDGPVTLLTSRRSNSVKQENGKRGEGLFRTDTCSTVAPTNTASDLQDCIQEFPCVKTLPPMPETKAAQGADGVEESPCVTSRAQRRRLTGAGTAVRRLTRKLTRRHSTLFTASKRVPAATSPSGTAPVFSQQLPDVTVAAVRATLENGDQCPLFRFMREVLKCTDIISTDWKESPHVHDTLVRKSHYKLSMPRNIPDPIAKLVGIPETIRSSTVWRLHRSSNELTLIQQSYTKDVRYGDRMTVQNTLSFSETGAGGVLFRQWVEVIWLSPLPWTHGIVKHFVEKRAKTETEGNAGALARIVQEEATRRMQIVCNDEESIPGK